MSEVWLARRKRGGLDVITKFALVENSEHVQANQAAIQNEAELLERFSHTSRIIQAYHSAQTSLPGRPYFIAAEYLTGGTIEDLLRQKKWWSKMGSWFNFTKTEQPITIFDKAGKVKNEYLGALPLEQALQIMRHAAAALAELHAAGIVHRDIKPENIMFRQRPSHGSTITADNLVLIDLGIAAVRGESVNAAISRPWAEPTRILAKENRTRLQVRSGFDIYSLGKVLRYMLLLEHPSHVPEEKLSAAIVPQKLRTQARLSKTQREQVASDVSTLIQGCLRANPSQRPSATQLITSIDQILNPLQKNRAIVRRGVFATASLAATALLLGTLLATTPESTTTLTSTPTPTSTPSAQIVAALSPTATSIKVSNPTETPLFTATPISTATPSSSAPEATEPKMSSTPTRRPTRRPTPTRTPTPMPTPTLVPTSIVATRAPTVRPILPVSSVPTPTYTVIPSPTYPPTVDPYSTVDIVLTNSGKQCHQPAMDSWGNEEFSISWEVGNSVVPPAPGSFRVVVWKDTNPSDKRAIHNATDIRVDGNRYTLTRRNLISNLVDKGTLPRGFNRWEIQLEYRSLFQFPCHITPVG